ncbi:MAG: AMP-binding protein [Thermodesulfobacteriota bacterium]
MLRAKLAPEDPQASLASYEEARRNFSWAEAEREFSWSETGKLNIVHEAVDRWALDDAHRNHKALIFEKASRAKEFTYGDLSVASSQWARLFMKHGLGEGDRVFIFLPSCPEVFFALLACARLGILFCVLFPSSSFDEIDARIRSARPEGLVTHPDLAERLPQQAMACVEHVFLTGGRMLDFYPSEIAVEEELKRFHTDPVITWVSGDTPLFLIYTTSGTAGPPKAVVHAHKSMVGHVATARHVLDVRDDTVLWTDAGEPGWVTGMVYGLFAPLLCGITSVIQGDQFSASTWYRTLERYKVSVWYTTPRTISRLMEAGDDVPGRYDLTSLRHVATVGEVLSPEQFYWARHVLKHSPHDTWWMTETGMICIANFPWMSIKPGSMGKPVPGIEAAVVNDQGEPVSEYTMGELALKPDWPALMTALWDDETRYRHHFRFGGLFVTGDMVTTDEEGYYYFDGRNDDLIKVGIRDMGPYELEQILGLHQAVAEAKVIAVRGLDGKANFRAFVRVKDGFTPSKRLNLEIRNFVRASFSPEIPLSEIVFMDELPRARSGIPLRSMLIAKERGLPTGDPGTAAE